MAKRNGEGEGVNPLGWMLTFSDLVTLLLTFFVMLLAMKEPELPKFESAFGIFAKGSDASLMLSDRSKVEEFQSLLDSLKQPHSEEFDQASQKLAIQMDLPQSNETAIQGKLLKQITLRGEDRGTVITLANDLLFQPGSTDLSPAATQAIHQVADLLRYSDQDISVEGHTDNTPLAPGAPFADNWDLSLARAMAVLNYLVAKEGIAAKRLRVGALDSTRPLVANDSPQHRELNRRTEIVLLNR